MELVGYEDVETRSHEALALLVVHYNGDVNDEGMVKHEALALLVVHPNKSYVMATIADHEALASLVVHEMLYYQKKGYNIKALEKKESFIID